MNPEHDYISIDTDKLKQNGTYTQEIELNDNNYIFTFKVNKVDRTITIDISDDEGPIYYGEPLILNQPLWRYINDPRLPGETLIPLSNNNDEQIDLDNLNQSVFLCIDNLGSDN